VKVPTGKSLRALDWAAFRNGYIETGWENNGTPEFRIEPVLWRYTTPLSINQHFPAALCHPAIRCKGRKLGFYHATQFLGTGKLQTVI
jgi:hypothetical protein